MTNIAMENPNHKWRFSSLGKSSINGPSKNHGYVSHNQRVEAEKDEFQAFVWFFHDLSAV